MRGMQRLVVGLGVGAATLTLAAAGAPGTAQPSNSCLATFSDRPVRTHGVQGRSSILVQTTKPAKGRLVVYAIGDLVGVRAVDGAAHTVVGVVYFQIKGEAQQQPTPFVLHATPSADTDAFANQDPATTSNYLELDGPHTLRTKIRSVVHIFGGQYPSGWATVGRGAPACEP